MNMTVPVETVRTSPCSHLALLRELRPYIVDFIDTGDPEALTRARAVLAKLDAVLAAPTSPP